MVLSTKEMVKRSYNQEEVQRISTNKQQRNQVKEEENLF